MSRLKFIYKAKITFSEKVTSHSFLLRLLPFENGFQRILKEHYEIAPSGIINSDVDCFGNKTLSGYIDGYHDVFEYSSEGEVETFPYFLDEPLNPVYCFSSKYTQPSENLFEMNRELNLPPYLDIHEKLRLISEKIASSMSYEKGATTIETTAEESLAIGKGVCQDYSHIMIAICRLNKIPARYVAGFIEGEGATHAWIEYYANDGWYGYDPTHDVKIAINYIKIAQGRDYADCALDNGIFRGVAQQSLEVTVKVEHQ